MNAAIKSGGYDVGGVIAKYTPRVHVSTGGVQYCGVDASARFDVFAHTRVPGPKTIIILPPPRSDTFFSRSCDSDKPHGHDRLVRAV